MLSLLERNKSIIVKGFAQTVDNLEAPFKAVYLGRLFYRHLENCEVERAYGDLANKHSFPQKPKFN